MKAAIAVYEHEGKLKIFPGEFGHAPFFAIVDLDSKQLVEKRDNPFKAEESKDKFMKLADYLKDVNYFVGKQFGSNALRLKEKFNIVPIVINAETLEEALEKIEKNKEKLNLGAHIVIL